MKALSFTLVGILVFAIWWKARVAAPRPATPTPAVAAVDDDPAAATGWTTVPVPGGGARNHVWIVAAINCPKEATQRANWLAHELASQNIPYTRTESVDFHPTSEIETQRLQKLLNGSGPFVFVNGKGKLDPSLDEVLTEYWTAKP